MRKCKQHEPWFACEKCEPRKPDESLAAHRARLVYLNREHTLGTAQGPTISTAWGEWLSCFPWDAWGTLTFAAGEFTHEAASRAFARFARHFTTHHPIGTWFVGHEVGARGRLHLHCLLGQMMERTPEARSALWEWWFKRYGRAQVLGYDPEKGAAHYCAKYVSKELAHYDLDFGGWFIWDSGGKPRQSSDGPTWVRRRSAPDSTGTRSACIKP